MAARAATAARSRTVAAKVYVWNTRPKNLEYYTEKWNEFLAA